MSCRQTDEFGNYLVFDTEEEKKWAKILLEKTAIQSTYVYPIYPEDQKQMDEHYYYPIDIIWAERRTSVFEKQEFGLKDTIGLRYKIGLMREDPEKT